MISISLRDWFAGLAMQGMIINSKDSWPFNLSCDTGDDDETHLGIAAATAYYIADRMLEARK